MNPKSLGRPCVLEIYLSSQDDLRFSVREKYHKRREIFGQINKIVWAILLPRGEYAATSTSFASGQSGSLNKTEEANSIEVI